jgi:hypothetical protein
VLLVTLTELFAGCLFTDFTCKLMVSHVCEQKYRPFYTGMAIFAISPAIASLDLRG